MTTATARAPRRSSLAVVECLLENRCRNPRRRRKIFRSSADGARVEEQGEDVAGEWVGVGGKALLGPENPRLMREAEEKERKTKVSEVAKRAEREKKSNGALACPRIRGKQQREEGKQSALGRRKPPRCVWSGRDPRRRRKIFRSSANGARVEEQGEDVAGEWVGVGGKALLGPENSCLMREAEEKNEKRRSARWQNA